MYEVIPEFKGITELSEHEKAFNAELATLPVDSQRSVLNIVRLIVEDNLLNYIHFERQRLRVSKH